MQINSPLPLQKKNVLNWNNIKKLTDLFVVVQTKCYTFTNANSSMSDYTNHFWILCSTGDRNYHSFQWSLHCVEIAALTFRTKRYSTSYGSHICYGKRFYNDSFLNHNTIALVRNCLKLLSCVAVWSLRLLWTE